MSRDPSTARVEHHTTDDARNRCSIIELSPRINLRPFALSSTKLVNHVSRALTSDYSSVNNIGNKLPFGGNMQRKMNNTFWIINTTRQILIYGKWNVTKQWFLQSRFWTLLLLLLCFCWLLSSVPSIRSSVAVFGISLLVLLDRRHSNLSLCFYSISFITFSIIYVT